MDASITVPFVRFRCASPARTLCALLSCWALLASRSALAQPPTAALDWSMPDRFGKERQADGRLVLYRYDSAYVNPPSWSVTLDGCASKGEPADPIASYAWEIDGVAQGSTSQCRFGRELKSLGTHQVKLTVRTRTGKIASALRNVELKDTFIVSLGESFASGEGNPDVPSVMQKILSFDAPKEGPKWVDARCHRSARSGHAQVALALEQADPRSSVTFVSFACSGAAIEGSDVKTGGLLTPYEGSEPADPPLDSQINSVIAASCPDASKNLKKDATGWHCAVPLRRIDALLLSVGGNDVGFGDLIQGLVENEMHLVGYTGGDFADRQRIQATFDARLAMLPGRYAKLAAAIRTLNVQRVFISEYPDPTQDEQRKPCSNKPLGDLFGWYPLPDPHVYGRQVSGIDADEAKWASDYVVTKLNGAVKAAADRWGWKLVGGVAEAFRGHGWCAGAAIASAPWEFIHDASSWDPYRPVTRFMRTYEDSRYTQGPFEITRYGESHGAMHPNGQGHQVYRDLILAAVRGQIPPPPAPALLVQVQPGGPMRAGVPVTITIATYDTQTGTRMDGLPLNIDGVAGRTGQPFANYVPLPHPTPWCVGGRPSPGSCITVLRPPSGEVPATGRYPAAGFTLDVPIPHLVATLTPAEIKEGTNQFTVNVLDAATNQIPVTGPASVFVGGKLVGTAGGPLTADFTPTVVPRVNVRAIRAGAGGDVGDVVEHLVVAPTVSVSVPGYSDTAIRYSFRADQTRAAAYRQPIH